MKKIRIAPRVNYKQKIEELGFNYNADYWLEDYYFELTSDEIDALELATARCHEMFETAAQYAIDNNLLHKFHIPEHLHDAIRESWKADLPSIYGRFDFALVDGVPKLFEYNADTPTSLFEASIVQHHWLEEVIPQGRQYNCIHENLIASWNEVYDDYNQYTNRIDFCCIHDNVEDFTNTAYMCSTAADGGLHTSMFDISDLKFDEEDGYHCTPSGEMSEILFKLYPWEWLANEAGSETLPGTNTLWIEPIWKMLYSNKYMLVLLSELFPDSKYILKAGEQPIDKYNYCRKPIFSREGANVSLVKDNEIIAESTGEYGEEGYIYQEFVDVPFIDGSYPVIGSWVIGGVPSGIGIRDTSERITTNMSKFIPHVVR